MMIDVTYISYNDDNSINEEMMLIRTNSITAIRDYVVYFDTQKIDVKETAEIVRERMRISAMFR